MYNRPSIQEYTPYFGTYIDLVPEGDIKDLLRKQFDATNLFLSTLSDEQANYRYAPDKWTIKEVVGHITDTERIMCYRLLRIARGDRTPLAGVDDDAYVRAAEFQSRPLSELIEEYKAVRLASLSLLGGLPEEAWCRKGVANNSELSARALAYIIAGHELHHIKIIQERYLL